MSEKKTIKNKILCLSALGERFISTRNNQKFVMLPNKSKNVYISFSPLNKPLSKEYAKFIEISIKYKLKDDLINLINNIRNSKSVQQNRINIINFQHKLYIEVALQMLVHYYNLYNSSNRNISFEQYVNSKCNNMTVCKYIDKLIYNTKDKYKFRDLLEKDFNNKKQQLSEKMDIQLFTYLDNMIMPKYDLDLNTTWKSDNNYRNLQGGLYDIDIHPIDLVKRRNNPPNKMDFCNWYNSIFHNSILPPINIVSSRVNNKYFRVNNNSIKTTSKEIIELIENMDETIPFDFYNNIILCLFYCDKPNNRQLSQQEMKLYNQQGINLVLNKNKPQRDINNNWIIDNLQVEQRKVNDLYDIFGKSYNYIYNKTPLDNINPNNIDRTEINKRDVDKHQLILDKINKNYDPNDPLTRLQLSQSPSIQVSPEQAVEFIRSSERNRLNTIPKSKVDVDVIELMKNLNSESEKQDDETNDLINLLKKSTSKKYLSSNEEKNEVYKKDYLNF